MQGEPYWVSQDSAEPPLHSCAKGSTAQHLVQKPTSCRVGFTGPHRATDAVPETLAGWVS